MLGYLRASLRDAGMSRDSTTTDSTTTEMHRDSCQNVVGRIIYLSNPKRSTTTCVNQGRPVPRVTGENAVVPGGRQEVPRLLV